MAYVSQQHTPLRSPELYALRVPSMWGVWAIVIILLFLGCPPWGMSLCYTVSTLLLPVSLWFLLYIFSYRKSFLLVLRSFSLIVALQIVIVLVCL